MFIENERQAVGIDGVSMFIENERVGDLPFKSYRESILNSDLTDT